MRPALIAAALMLMAVPALAQAPQAPQPPVPQQPPRDTRLDADQINALSATVNAVNSQIEFLQKKHDLFQRDAAAKIIASGQADEAHQAEWAKWYAAREAEWAEYTRPLFATPHAAIAPKSEPAPLVTR